MFSDNLWVVLVDVCCEVEWCFVGVFDLLSFGCEVVYVEWVMFDGMYNDNFFVELWDCILVDVD